MIFLEDLLRAEEFSETVDRLALDFRQKYGLAGIDQLGLVVPDVEAAAGRLEDQGIGPFFIAQWSPVYWYERGEARKFQGKAGIASYRGIELELMEPGEGSDFYRQSLDPDGRIAVHHLGMRVRDVKAQADLLVEARMRTLVEAKLSLGVAQVDFAYLDTVDQAGYIIEFLAWRFLAWRFAPPYGLLKALGKLQKITGIRSLRFP